MPNDGYEASLERNKIYAVVPDDEAEQGGPLQVASISNDEGQPTPMFRRRL